jgi:hypothetical protein
LFGFLTRFHGHQLPDGSPVLKIGRTDHADKSDAAAGPPGAQAGPAKGHVHFGRVVDDHQKYRRATAVSITVTEG